MLELQDHIIHLLRSNLLVESTKWEGQHLLEMEVWALESHPEQDTLCGKCLQWKSDDVVGRAKAFEAIVKGTSLRQKFKIIFQVLIKNFKHF